MSRFAPILLLLVFSACGSKPPTGPSAPPPPPPPTFWTLSGTLTETLGGAPIAGATLEFWQMGTATTDGSGRWNLTKTETPRTPIYTEIKSGGYVDRRVYFTWTSAGRSDIRVDMIRDAAPYTLGLFRQILRNDLDEPGVLYNLRRWTTAPNFYINTFNPRTGRPLLQRELDIIVDGIRNAVPQATAGHLQAGVIEAAVGERAHEPGVIYVDLVYEPHENYCGKAEIAKNPGRIWLNYERCAASCRGEAVDPWTVAHEVGHAMGLYHHTGGGIMTVSDNRNACMARNFSELEQFYARLLHARQPGNADLDWDQPTTPTALGSGAPKTVVCFR